MLVNSEPLYQLSYLGITLAGLVIPLKLKEDANNCVLFSRRPFPERR